MKTSLTTLSAALALALLAGCASDGGLKPQARIRSANTLVADHGVSGAAVSPAAWPASDWYARYGDAQLDALVKEAMAANPSPKKLPTPGCGRPQASRRWPTPTCRPR